MSDGPIDEQRRKRAWNNLLDAALKHGYEVQAQADAAIHNASLIIEAEKRKQTPEEQAKIRERVCTKY